MSNVLSKAQKHEITQQLMRKVFDKTKQEIVSESLALKAQWLEIHTEHVLEVYPFLTLEQIAYMRQKHAAVALTNAAHVREVGRKYFESPARGEVTCLRATRERDLQVYTAMASVWSASALEFTFTSPGSKYTEEVKWHLPQSFPSLIHVPTIHMNMSALDSGEWPANDEEGLKWARKGIAPTFRGFNLSKRISELFEEACQSYELIDGALRGINTYTKLEEFFPEGAEVCPDKPEKVKAVMDVDQINKARELLGLSQ